MSECGVGKWQIDSESSDGSVCVMGGGCDVSDPSKCSRHQNTKGGVMCADCIEASSAHSAANMSDADKKAAEAFAKTVGL